jgi:hypothetical protein
MNHQPLPLPADFNTTTHMISKTTEYGVFHETRRAARLAEQLVANGTPTDLTRAEAVLEAVLACQERDPQDPHCGNFYWMREDEVVEDLNAVEFVLEALIPMMLRHGDRLAPPLRERVLDSIRLGLAEIARLDVLVAYTNITALDILNTTLGGELLGDEPSIARGAHKLVRWIEYTNQSGHPLEYNSPTYSAVTLRALKRLADETGQPEVRLRARAMAARLALSYALHIHIGAGRLAGPHGRAYQPTIAGETPPELDTIRNWVADGIAPPWIADVLDERPATFTVVETAERSRGLSITTHHTPSFALGVASQSFHPQSNHCMVHYRQPGAERPGVFYTRYVLDDKWFGDHYHPTDRTKSRNLLDEGDFFGVQDEDRAIAVYTASGFRHGTSAKAALIWQDYRHVDEIWVGDQRIDTAPCAVPPGETVVIGSGEVYMAVRPLLITPLGRETPVQLVVRNGDLVLELYNYCGPQKRFWELNWPGAFFQGRPVCAFYLEVTERAGHRDGAAFGRTVMAGEFASTLAPGFTSAADGERHYTASYTRADRTLGLSIDTIQWQLLRRWTTQGDPGWPMLSAPMAAQSSHGFVQVENASVQATGGPVWLFAAPRAKRWVAGYLGTAPTTLTLSTPEGSATIEEMGTGTVVWADGEVHVEAVGR